MAAARTSTAASATTKTSAADGAPKTRGRPQGILKPQPVSPAFERFLGMSEISRSDAVKIVWDYIKEKKLQNPENKKEIFCDEKLKTIFSGRDKVGFLEIASLISKQFQKAS